MNRFSMGKPFLCAMSVPAATGVLRSEVAELKKSVDAQSAEIKVLHQKIDEAKEGRR